MLSRNFERVNMDEYQKGKSRPFASYYLKIRGFFASITKFPEPYGKRFSYEAYLVCLLLQTELSE